MDKLNIDAISDFQAKLGDLINKTKKGGVMTHNRNQACAQLQAAHDALSRAAAALEKKGEPDEEE